MNRGSSGRGAEAGARAPGFNEAPIHESGKYGSVEAQRTIDFRLQ